MTATIRKPQSLAEYEFIVLTVTRDTRELSMVLPDQQSFDLGSVWDAEYSAVPYIAGALGRESFWRTLAADAVTTAFNFGAAIIDIDRRLSSSILENDPKKDEARALVKMFERERQLLERDDRHEDGLTVIEPFR